MLIGVNRECESAVSICWEGAAAEDRGAVSEREERLGRTADEVLEGNAWQGEILHPGMTIYGGKSGG